MGVYDTMLSLGVLLALGSIEIELFRPLLFETSFGDIFDCVVCNS